MPTLTVIDGFTHGSVASGAGGVYTSILGTPAIVTTPARTGSSGKILQINPTAATENVRYATPAGTRQIAASFYVRFAALPSAVMMLHYFPNTNGSLYFKYHQTTGQFGLIAVEGGTTVAGGPTVAVDTWYLVDLLLDSSTGTASLKCRIDGGTEFEFQRTQVANDTIGVSLGTASSATGEAFFSDWVCSYTAADYPLGEHRVEQLLPGADGTHSVSGANIFERGASGTDITNATTDAYTLVDDATLDLTFTTPDYINQVGNSVTNYVEMVFGDLAASTDVPADVWGYSTDRDSTATGSSPAKTQVLYNGTSTDLRVTTDDPGVTPTVRKKMLTRPTGDWTRTKVDGITARFGFGDGAPDVWLGSIMVEVALFPGGTNATVTPAAVAVVAAIPTPTLSAGSTVEPAAVAAVAAVPTPTIPVPDATVTPATVATVAAVPGPTTSAGSTVTPATVAAVAAVPTPPLAASSTVTPAAVAAIAAVPTPTVSAGSTVAPATVASVAGVPTPTLSAGSTVTPGTVAAVATVPTPTVSAGGNITVTPAAVAAAVAVPTPSVSAGGTASPATVAAIAAVPLPALLLSTMVQPAVVAALVSVPTPTVTTGASDPGVFSSPTHAAPLHASTNTSARAATTSRAGGFG